MIMLHAKESGEKAVRVLVSARQSFLDSEHAAWLEPAAVGAKLELNIRVKLRVAGLRSTGV